MLSSRSSLKLLDWLTKLVFKALRFMQHVSLSVFKGEQEYALIGIKDGFLLSQFMSPNSNQRDDEFGGSAEKRVELVLRIIQSIRKEVSKSFCVGVKINSADFKDEEGMAEMLRQIELIQQEEIDYINLSGGSFEDPQMMSTDSSLQPSSAKSRSGIREGFFLRTSEEIRRRFPDLTLLVTGGFRSRNGVAGALNDNACDLIGLGRPAVKYPELPRKIMFNEDISDAEARFDVESAPGGGWLASKVRSVGAGTETVSSHPLIEVNLYHHFMCVIVRLTASRNIGWRL